MSLLTLQVYLLLLTVWTKADYQQRSSPPNIIFIMADDLGWNDVSFHGYNEIPTPNIDQLAHEGIVMNSFYGQYQCTPSRVALMTAKYPMRFGLQHLALSVAEDRGLNLSEKILPQYMKELGYSTHMIGKWHLGYSSDLYTPTKRGFDSFFGFYNGATDYFNYTYTDPGRCYNGRYATELFTERALDVINYHDKTQPLFLYLAHYAPHAAAFRDPVEAPQRLIDKFSHITNEGRRKYAATITALDESVGQVISALKKKGMLDNAVIVFSSDNGGVGQELLPFFPLATSYGSNWPLRGVKFSQWEGGVRVAALIWSKALRQSRRVSNELYHMADWLPTLYKLAGGGVLPSGIDGFDIWPSLSDNLPSPRTELLIQVDPLWNEYALRWNQFKLVLGSQVNNGVKLDNWYLPPEGINPDFLLDVPGALRCVDGDRIACDANVAACLFDVVADPCEYFNIASSQPDLVEFLLAKLESYNSTAVFPQDIIAPDPRAQTSLNHGLIRPWIK